MADRYLLKRIKRNWQTIVIIILSIIFIGILAKNVGEIPYENRHLQSSTLPLQFEYNDKKVMGFIYAAYWVETKPKIDKNLSPEEMEDYLFEKGYIELRNYKDEFIKTLKTYSLEKMKEEWYDDIEYFRKNNIYYIENDPKLENRLKELNPEIELPYKTKKVFFVYLDSGDFAEFMENLDKPNIPVEN